jgi:hypothetical protein
MSTAIAAKTVPVGLAVIDARLATLFLPDAARAERFWEFSPRQPGYFEPVRKPACRLVVSSPRGFIADMISRRSSRFKLRVHRRAARDAFQTYLS